MKTIHKRIRQYEIVLYAVLFIIFGMLAVHYNWSSGNSLIDVAVIGLAAALAAHEIAWYYGQNHHKK